jgi:hypothetical protein
LQITDLVHMGITLDELRKPTKKGK